MKQRGALGLAALACAVVCLLVSALAAGCAAPTPLPLPLPTTLPLLRLPPAALGPARYELSQRLSVTPLELSDASPQQVDVQLQLDASGLRLAGFAYGQRVLLMQWDGAALRLERHPRLPDEVDANRMLRDLCLVFWPAEAVRAALPEGWHWVDANSVQSLQQGDATWLTVRRSGQRIVEIINTAEGYRLLIESQPLEPS